MAAFPSYKSQKIYDRVGAELQKIRQNSEKDSTCRDVNIHQPYFRGSHLDDTMDYRMRKRRKSGKENTLDTMSCHKVLDSIMMFKSITLDRHANFFIEQEVSLDEADNDLDFVPQDTETRDVFVKKEPVFPVKTNLPVFGKGSSMYNPIVIFDGKEVDIEEDGVEVSEDKDETIEVINLDDSSEQGNESTSKFEDVINCNSKQLYEQKESSLSINNTLTGRNSNSDRTKLNEEAFSHLRVSDDINDDFAMCRTVLLPVAKTKYTSSESFDEDLTEPVPILTITLSEGKRQIKSYSPCQTMTDKDTDSIGFSVNNGQIKVKHSLVKSLTSYKSTTTEKKKRESKQLKDTCRYGNKQKMLVSHEEIAPCEQFHHVKQSVQRSSSTEVSKVTSGIVNGLAITRCNMRVSVGKELNTKEKNAEKTEVVKAKVSCIRNTPSVDCSSECSTNNVKHTASDAAKNIICDSTQKASSHTEAHHRRYDSERYRTESKDKRHRRKDGNSRRNYSDDRGYVRNDEDSRKNISYNRRQDKDLNRNILEDRRDGRQCERIKRSTSEEKRLGRKDEEINRKTAEERRHGRKCEEIKISTSEGRRLRRKDEEINRKTSEGRRKCEEIKSTMSEERRQGKEDVHIKRNTSGDRRHGKTKEVTERNTLEDRKCGRQDENLERKISEFNGGDSSFDRNGSCSVSISENKPNGKQRPWRQRKKPNETRENDSNQASSWPSRHFNRNPTSYRKDTVQQYQEKYKSNLGTDRTLSIRSNRDTKQDQMSYHYSWNQRIYKRLHMEIPWDPIGCYVCRSQFRSYQALLQHVTKFHHCPFKSSYTCNTAMYLCCYCPYESKTLRKILMHYKASHGIYFRQYGLKQVMIQALCRM